MDFGILQKLVDATPRRFPDSQLFNESWMLSLLLLALEQIPNVDLPFAFPSGTEWFSEASLRSPYPNKNGLSIGEGSTNADALIGDFKKREKTKAGIQVEKGARRLIILEAKMGSGLAKGTRHASQNNQAARSLACLAYELSLAGIHPDSLEHFGFFLIAPETSPHGRNFLELLKPENLQGALLTRVTECFRTMPDRGPLERWWESYGQPLSERLSIANVEWITWERCLKAIRAVDVEQYRDLHSFYQSCWGGRASKSKDV